MKRAIWVALVLAGCGSSSPANVAGTYTVAGTDEANGCMIGTNWTQGNTFTGVTVTITQSPGSSTATAMVTGLGSLGLDALLGTSSFTGSVDGDSVDLKAIGTVAQHSGNCTYTVDGEIKATLSGDSLAGTIDYTTQTNSNTDCTTITGCLSTQDFNGSRPPP
ncbi:MAG TPA: hypothetical protein VMJ10_13030 [Kofleriaceae bacterium]|nr:hypothetical protein [Kofleriaceae bacterium]